KRGPTNVAHDDDPAVRFRRVVMDEVYCYAVFGLMRAEVLGTTGLIGSFAQSDRVLLAELALHGRFVELDEPCFRHREPPGRSMYAYADDRDRQRWFDTSRDGTLTMPRWRLGVEYRRALTRAGSRLTTTERRRAATTFGPWGLANGPVLGRELARTTMVRAK